MFILFVFSVVNISAIPFVPFGGNSPFDVLGTNKQTNISIRYLYLENGIYKQLEKNKLFMNPKTLAYEDIHLPKRSDQEYNRKINDNWQSFFWF